MGLRGQEGERQGQEGGCRAKMGALRPRWEGSKAKIGGSEAMIGGSKANFWRFLGSLFLSLFLSLSPVYAFESLRLFDSCFLCFNVFCLVFPLSNYQLHYFIVLWLPFHLLFMFIPVALCISIVVAKTSYRSSWKSGGSFSGKRSGCDSYSKGCVRRCCVVVVAANIQAF